MSTHLTDGTSEDLASSGAQSTSTQDNDSKQPETTRRKRFALIGLVAVLALGAILIYAHFQHSSATDKQKDLHVSGRIESPETHLSAAMAARVKLVAVKEGDHVHIGQLLISLDARAVQTKISEASSFIREARDAQNQANKQVSAAQSDIAQARAKSKGLMAKLFGSKKKKEEKTAQLRHEMTAAEIQLHQAQAAVVKAQAAKAEGAEKLSYFNITSPINGICVTRSIEPGEIAGPGQVLMVLSDPNSAYLKGFIAEGDVGKVKIGQQARVYLDSNPKQPLSGRITSIDGTASFTPENVYFKKDRVRQVFGMKIAIDHPNGLAKPGMPADAQIILPNSNTAK